MAEIKNKSEEEATITEDEQRKMARDSFTETISNSRHSKQGLNLVDAVLLANGKEFPVHTFVLSMRCEYFKVFFKSSLNAIVDLTGNAIEDGKPKVSKLYITEGTVPTVFPIDQDPEVLEKILQYIYGDPECFEFEFFQLATSTIMAANEYMLKEYGEICGSFIISQLTEENFVDIYNLGMLLNNQKILNGVRKYSCDHPDEESDKNFNELTLEAFNDYFKHFSKHHPNKAIIKLNDYFNNFETVHKKKVPEYPMEDMKENIDWLRVENEQLRLVNDKEYITLKSLNNIMIKLLKPRKREEQSKVQADLKKEIDRYCKAINDNPNARCSYGYDFRSHPNCGHQDCPIYTFYRIKDQYPNIPKIKEEIEQFKGQMASYPNFKCIYLNSQGERYDQHGRCKRYEICPVHSLMRMFYIIESAE